MTADSVTMDGDPRDSSESPSPTPPGSPKYGRNLRVTAAATQGGRKYMEDRVHIECVRRSSDGDIDYVFLAIYDGHGGPEASEFARQFLLSTIQAQPEFASNRDEDILLAIRHGFIETHQAMWRNLGEWPRTASGYASTAGTTASVAFIRNGKLYTGHVGDSAIILGKRLPDGTIAGRRLTVEHKPDSAEEERRIEDAGGQVLSKAGVMRVVWNRPARGHTGPVRRSTPREAIPFLAVARALGDLWSYNADTEQFIVSPEPDVDVCELKADDVCLVLCSDGMTNVLRPQYALDIVNTHEWKELNEERGPNAQLLTRPSHSNHSRWLLRHSLRGWGGLRADNISVITVIFDPPGSQLSNGHPCVENDCPAMSIDRELTGYPSAMVRICPETCQRLKTAPVELIYAGAYDPQQVLVSNFSGPGFSTTAASSLGFGSNNQFVLTPEEAADATIERNNAVESNSGRGFGFDSFFGISHTNNKLVAAAVVVEKRTTTTTVVLRNPRVSQAIEAKEEEEEEAENKGEESDEESKAEIAMDEDNGETNEKPPPPVIQTPQKRKLSAAGQLSANGRKKSDTNSTPSKIPKLSNPLPPAVNDRPSPAPTNASVTPTKKQERKVKYICRKHGLDCEKVKRINAEFIATGIRQTPNRGISIASKNRGEDKAEKVEQGDEEMWGNQKSGEKDAEMVPTPSPSRPSTTDNTPQSLTNTGSSQRRGRGRPPGSKTKRRMNMGGSSTPLRQEKTTMERSFSATSPFESSPSVEAIAGLLSPNRSSKRVAARSTVALSSLTTTSTITPITAPLTPFRRLALDTSVTKAAMAGGASGLAAAMRSVSHMQESNNGMPPVKRPGMATRAFRSLSHLHSAIGQQQPKNSPGSAQKRRLDTSSESNPMEPTAKRSRIWGFFSNMLGGK